MQRIPPAPRRVAWRRVLSYRWPLLFLCFALSVYGGVVTWLFFLANSHKALEAERLAAGPTVTVEAVVERTVELGAAGRPVQRVEYRFAAEGQVYSGTSKVPGGAWRQGQAVTVLYLAGQPSLNRIQDAPPDMAAVFVEPRDTLVLLVVPGLLLGMLYLAGALRLRSVLMHGDVSVATIASVRILRGCLPESVSVRFSFRDHRATLRHSRHWVRTHSPLGERLVRMQHTGAFERVPVLHDRHAPQRCRLVLPQDFTAATPTP